MKDIISIPDQIDLHENFERIDSIVDEAIKEGTVEPVVNYIYNLRLISELAGKGLARFLYRVRQNWDKFIESESDDFKDYMSAVIGIHPHTVERYVGVAEKAEDDFDFYERLEELNEELEQLNVEARELEERIAENISGILQ